MRRDVPEVDAEQPGEGGGEVSDQEKRCGTCKHFAHKLSARNRKLPSRLGKCDWPIPWPDVWPTSYLRWGGMHPLRPEPLAMWPGDGARCECWEPGKAVNHV